MTAKKDVRMHDLTDREFGMLTVLHENGRNERMAIMWLCQCECGGQRTVTSRGLMTGEVSHCGCMRYNRKNVRERFMNGKSASKISSDVLDKFLSKYKPKDDGAEEKSIAKEDYIVLKWGTLKDFRIGSQDGEKLIEKYRSLGTSSAMTQSYSEEQKEIICRIIDACNANRILLDWNGKYVSKHEAKKYVMNYER